MQRQGQLNLGCTNCHDDNWDKRLAGSAITQGHPTGYPLYRLEWQSLGSLQRRLRNCMTGIRAQPYDYGAPELVELELYLMSRARGMPMEAPAVRPEAVRKLRRMGRAQRNPSIPSLGYDGFRCALPILHFRDLERLTFRERLLDHELRGLAVIAFDKALAVEQVACPSPAPGCRRS